MSKEEITVAELLKADLEEELDRRDGEWSAFSHAVFRQLDEQETAAERSELEERAIGLLKQEVDVELSEMAPRFEDAFKESVEKRIFRSAIDEPTVGDRVRSWWSRVQLGFGMAGAAVAVGALLFAVVPRETTQLAPEEIASGHVSVQRISFDGNVTVLPDEGVTVVWLDGPQKT